MASHRSSADEGEIVEQARQGAAGGPHVKAKTTAAVGSAASAHASYAVGRIDVDRRDRLRRGPSPPRSPAREAPVSSYPYRSVSPRGQKRQRDDRTGRGGRDGDSNAFRRGGDHSPDRGNRYDNRSRENNNNNNNGRRRGGPRDNYFPQRGDRDKLRYDDRDDERDRDRTRYDNSGHGSKRQRTRSRSPPPSSFSRGGESRGRNDHGWRERRDRDRDFDRNRDRDYHRDQPVDRDGDGWGQGGRSERPTEPTNGHSMHPDRGGEALSEQNPAPVPQEDYVEPEPVDEEAEIRRRRQRREEILRKSRAATPMLALALQTDKATLSAPATGGSNTPGAVDPATATGSPASTAVAEALDLNGGPDFANVLGKQNDKGGSNGAPNGGAAAHEPTGNDDGPSAADYDPTVDMAEDERRDELRHGGAAAAVPEAEEKTEEVRGDSGSGGDDGAGADVAKDGVEEEDKEEDDEDDMFAEDFVEKKYQAPKGDKANNEKTTVDVDALPVAAGNGGGILEGDDQQGYYKMRPGEVMDGRYQIQSTLGKGMFSGVVQARDMASADKRVVAIKIMRNNDALRKGGYTEIAILQKLNEADGDNRKHIVRFERSFDLRGHLCMVFENLSLNLREVLKKFGNNVGISLHGVRVYAYQIFVALAHMRRCSIIHADLKPDNILVDESRSTVKICDLGTAIDRSDAVSAHVEITPYLVSRFYRAPEIILGMPYDYAIDMWSIGCTLYELYTGKILFTGESNNQMLRAIMEVRGKISGKLYRRGELWRMHFDDMGGFLSQEQDKFQGKTTIKTLPMVKPTRDLRTRVMAASYGMSDAETRDVNQFLDLLDRCLALNPDKRILPGDALKHPFFTSRVTK